MRWLRACAPHAISRAAACGVLAQVALVNLAHAAEPAGNGAYSSTLTAGAVVQTILGLIAVVVVIIAAAWLLRRVAQLQTGAQGALKVLASMPLGSRERVVLIQVGDRQLLLGIAPGHVSTLHVLDQALLAEGEADTGMRFHDRLKQMLGQSASRGTAAKPGSRS
ncbi:MAG: flagellar biosynthetic protein FliO [Gammaproteobacteria bacterium]|nr:flagellar biosynthetic protein FliO [Gammaproteobacteria bacterium]